MNKLKPAFAILATSVLLACGGGGGGDSGGGVIAEGADSPTQSSIDSNNPDQVVLLAGTGTLVDGTVFTSKYLLKSMSWQVSAFSPTDADLTLQNQTCGAVIKQDVAEPIMPAGSGYGKSTWTCSLGVVSPVNVKADAVYKLLLVGIDQGGQSTTVTKSLVVKPNANFTAPTSSTLNVAIIGSLVGRPGQTLNLAAAAEWTSAAKTPLIYSWSLGAGSERLATLLSSTGTSIQLYLAPGQTTAARVSVTVTATGNGVTASATMVAVIEPAKLNIATVGGLVGKPGQLLNLGALAEWTDPAVGTETPVIYSWSLGAGSEQLATLLSNTGTNIQLYLSPGQTAPGLVPVNVTASGNGASASATMFALIDPFEPLAPTILRPVQDVAPTCRVQLQAEDLDVGVANLFYQWSVVEGSQVPLGGANTLNVGFFAPLAEQVMRIRFAVGYYPITSSYPGVYFVDALVRVTNAGPCPQTTGSTVQ